MAVFAQKMSKFLLFLVLVGLMASLIECTAGGDPDDYEDLEEDDDDFVFEEDDVAPSSVRGDRPKSDEKLSPERYFTLLRPRLGHFERYPELRKLYEDYFEKSMQRRDASMSRINKAEDWRFVRPTPEFCVSFLSIFKSKKYMINKPIDIIPLDACLEWLFLDKVTVPKGHPDFERQELAVGERELDLKQTQSSFTISKAEDLRLDSSLESIYTETLFGVPDEPHQVDGKRVLKDVGVPRRMRLKIKKYLLRLLDINDQNPGKGCHSLWLDAYTSFMEQVYQDCTGQSDCAHFGDERLDEDRYFRLIAESTRQSSVNCYKTMQSSILSLMRESYDSKARSVLLTRAMKLRKGKLDRQYENQKWSHEMVKILQLVSGADAEKPISLGEVVRKLWEIKGGDEDESNRFLRALGEYAIANTDMKHTDDDPQGVKRYARAMTRLCKPYIDEKLFLAKAGALDLDEDIKNKEPFLFYHIIYSLIRLTNHESIYDITKDQFEEDVLKNQWEALYLATFACQMMSTTTGELSQETNENAYEVSFQYDSVQYVEDWPLEVMNQKLVKVAGKADASVTIEPKRNKLNFRAKQSEDDEEEEDSGANAAAALWPDEANDTNDAKLKERGSKKHSSSSKISEYSDQISSKLKKTFGRFKFSSGGRPKKVNDKKGGFVMSEDMIRKFHRQYGRWPDLPENIREIYPNLPAECVAKRQDSNIGLKAIADLNQQQQQQQQQAPIAPAPVAPEAAPAQPRVINRQAVGYWPQQFSKEDGLPTWNTDHSKVETPPRRTLDDLF